MKPDTMTPLKRCTGWLVVAIIFLAITMIALVRDAGIGVVVIPGFISGVAQARAAYWRGYIHAIEEAWEKVE